jgi:transposase
MPIDPETMEKILELAQHEGTRKIAQRLGLSRKVIRRILERKVDPPERGKLDPFKERIEGKVRLGLTASRIFREIKELGYQGGRTILAQYVSSLRTQQSTITRRVKRRFETPPGQEMQVDWSPGRVSIAGKVTPIHVLGIVLGYSRKLFFSVFRDERSPTFLEGLAQGFDYYGGVALRCVFDYVPGHIIEVMCPIPLCGEIGKSPCFEPVYTAQFLRIGNITRWVNL